MYPIPPSETLVQTRTCRHCSALFPITDKDLEFYEKVSPVFPLQPSPPTPLPEGEGRKIEWNKVRYLIPTPTLCPDCRQQRRLSFINVFNLYKSWELVSPYSPDKWYNVVLQKDWFSDSIDWRNFWMNFDFWKSFSEQFDKLQRVAPRWDRISENCENCEWSLNIANSRNCYLVRSAIWCEDCYYSGELRWKNNSVMDSAKIKDGDICYEVVTGHNISNIFWGEEIVNCSRSAFLYDCENCEYCIGCVWLRNKKYFVLNKEVTEIEYESIYKKLFSDRTFRKDIIERFGTIKSSFPRLSNKLVNAEYCIGDEIFNSKNIIQGFFVNDSDDCKYIEVGNACHTCYDASQPDFVQKWYELSSVYKTYNSSFCYNCMELTNCFYCETSCYLKNCFACVWLNRAQYCILNKQYTKDEYEALVPKIIEHMMKSPLTPLTKGGSDEGAGGFEWWEFFPSSLSPFGYNETVAQEYYPLTRGGVLSLRGLSEAIQDASAIANLSWKEEIWPGCHPPRRTRDDGTFYSFQHWPIFNWSDYEPPFPRVEKIIPADKLPDDVSKIPDDILNWAIECEVTGKPFRIIKQELEFYRKHNLPIPRRHPDQRHLDRMALRNPRKLFERKCDKCGKDMITTYSPERKEVVYCESCYNAEVIW